MVPVRACPDRSVLDRLMVGRLPALEGEQLAQHLEQCVRCTTVVQTLGTEDALVEAARTQQTASEPEREAVRGLVERLRRLGPPAMSPAAEGTVTSTVGDTRSVGGSPPASPIMMTTVDLSNCLAPSQAADEIGRLGPYRVLRVLGHGGMGIVYQAEDTQLKRQVALKVMKPEVASRPTARDRFLREAQAAAGIEDDHIVTIYQVGVERGVPFLAMQWLKGMSLEDRLRRAGRLTIPQVLRLGRQIARGLQAAHERGLIHRDIKPGNLWLEPEQGGRIKILDFGLARAIGDDAHLTQSGVIVGTPAYMAPEQARGDKVDPRCDLFSLGVVLYRMCSGELPFRGDSTLAVLTALAVDHPRPLRDLNSAVPPALAEMVMRLLAKEPARRPASASEVADSLQTIERQLVAPVSGVSVSVVPLVPARQATAAAGQTATISEARLTPQPKASQGRRWAIPAIAAGVLVAALGGYLLIPGNHPGEPDDPGAKPGKPDPLAALKREQIPVHELKVAGRGDPEKAPEGLVAVLGDSQEKFWGVVASVAFSPDGQRLAATGKDNAINVWDVPTGKVACRLKGHKDVVTSVAFSPTRGTVLSGSMDWTARLWDPITAQEILTRDHGENNDVRSVAFSPDGQQFATSGKGGVLVWNTGTGQQRFPLEGHTGRVLTVAFSSKGQLIATGSQDRRVKLWNAQTGQILLTLTGYRFPVVSVAFSPDSRLLACGEGVGSDGSLTLWDTTTGALLRTLGKPTGRIHGVAFSPDGNWLVSASADHRVMLWEAGSDKKLQEWHLPGPVHSVAFAPDGRHLATGNSNGTIYILRLAAAPEPGRKAQP